MKYYIIKGGTWFGYAGFCRASDYVSFGPNCRYHIGFRLIKKIKP